MTGTHSCYWEQRLLACSSRVYHVQGVIGETYNIGTQKERQVVEVARDIAARFNLSEDHIVKVKDRAFNDQRYV